MKGAGLIMPSGALSVEPLGVSAFAVSVIEVLTEQPLQREAPDGSIETYTVPYDVPMVKVQYPNGLVKWHEATDLPSLLEKVARLLRNKFAVQSFQIAATPDGLSLGEIELTEVSYGSES